MKTNKILLSGTAVVALAGEISYGLTTSEIVAKSESSVVAIIEENTATHEYWQGTGWFITGNRIVTNEHVVSNERPCDQMRIVNVATLKHYTVGHIAYRDTTTDVAVIVINESNVSHLNFSELNPAPGA
jgi:S1-C subfamily serine protease